MSEYCRIRVKELGSRDLLDKDELRELREFAESRVEVFDAFFKAYDVDETVARLNQATLRAALFDYKVDLKRLKGLHQIEVVNSDKMKAYESSWFLRRKPIQLLQDSIDYVYLNETFVAWYLMEHLVGDLEGADKIDVFDEFYQQVLYHLIYRATDPQTLELMIVSFKSALEVYKRSVKA